MAGVSNKRIIRNTSQIKHNLNLSVVKQYQLINKYHEGNYIKRFRRSGKPS